MKRIYHHYLRWEDYKNGMWRIEPKEKELVLLKTAIEFTGDHISYGKAMVKVINSWPLSCEHNLTNESSNRRAWIGHAACSLEKNLPEYIVRRAWKHLTPLQRILANKQAERAIYAWIDRRGIISNQLTLF